MKIVDTNNWQILPCMGSYYKIDGEVLLCVMAYPNGLILVEKDEDIYK